MKIINKNILLRPSTICSILALSNNVVSAKEFIKPNVIVVLTDDLGYGDLGCHGNPWIKTQHIDKLYSESIRFTNFHVAPTCAPTRGALLTGRYPNAIGTWHTINGRNLLFKDEQTIGDLFTKNDYKTAFLGKWHLGNNYPYNPRDRGFQETLIHKGGGTSQTPDYWSNDNFNDTYWRDGKPEKFSGYCTDIWFNEAERFIVKNREKPFLLFISTNAAHAPFHVEKKYSDPYEKKNILNSAFYGMISNIDTNIGDLRKVLKKNKLTDNTILIFISDNGTAKGYNDKNKQGFNCGMRGIKGSVYEGGCRVPFFIYWVNGHLRGGKDIGTLAAHIDLLPTLAELCHLKPIKRTKDKKLHGKSLLPLLYNSSDKWKDRLLVIDSQRVHIPIKWRNSSTMTQRWRLINGKELYDIKRDKGQQIDLSKKYPKVVSNLRKGYKKWWDSVLTLKIASIPIGVEDYNEVRLTSHDWYMERNDASAWSQNLIREGVAKNGFWIIDVKSAGNYKIALRRWPKEINIAINSSIPEGDKVPNGIPSLKGVALNINKAKIKIAQINQCINVTKMDKEAIFNVFLKPGKYRFQTWFFSDDAPEGDIVERGAYYVYIRKK